MPAKEEEEEEEEEEEVFSPPVQQRLMIYKHSVNRILLLDQFFSAIQLY